MHATTPRALVVGYGRMGGFHAKVLRDLGYEVTTVDPDPARGADHATIADATFEHFDPMTPVGFDVAAIATPAEHLVESAFQLAGTRMLVEKPFATNVRDAAMLAAYLEACGRPVAVGFVERFNPVVRELYACRGTMRVKGAKFFRWNDRPCADPLLDLRLHDIDLARHLFAGYMLPQDAITFDTLADQSVKVRQVEVDDGMSWRTFNLMAHDQSPLHALWHAFLTDRDYPTPDDAVYALRVVERMRETEKGKCDSCGAAGEIYSPEHAATFCKSCAAREKVAA